MSFNSDRRFLLPLMITLCSVKVGFSQQSEKNTTENYIRNGCAATTVSATAIPVQKGNVYEHYEMEHPYGGTFQFIGRKDQPQEYFTDDIMNFIESNRLEEEDRIIEYSDKTRIRIPSKKTISRRNYKPYTTLYSFE